MYQTCDLGIASITVYCSGVQEYYIMTAQENTDADGTKRTTTVQNPSLGCDANVNRQGKNIKAISHL